MGSHDVVIVGAGISGLSFAHRSRAAGLRPLVIDGAPRLGGCIHSERAAGGYWLELGAHTCYNSYGGLLEIIDQCGLRPRLQSRARAPFRLLIDGEPRSVPSALHWLELLRSAPRALFVKKEGQTMRGYYGSIVGEQNYARVVSPLLAAVPSQCADEIPAEMLFKKRPRAKRTPRSFTLPGGLQTVVDAIADSPGIETRTGDPVTAVAASGDGYRISCASGDRLDAAAVVIALPPPNAAQVLHEAHTQLAETIGRIGVSRVATVGVIVRRDRLALPAVAGIVPTDDAFFSAVSRDTVPDDALRGFAFHFAADVPPSQRLERVTAVLGVSRQNLEHVAHKEAVLPAPRLGHSRIVKEIDRLLAGTRIAVTGSYFAGLAVEDCIGRSFAEVDRLRAALAS